MSSLKEIKGRISSVSSTLKITSAMKMVASAKLRKAQQAIGNMLSYEASLQKILLNLISSGASVEGENIGELMASRDVRHVAIVAFSSNSSLCGAYNSNAIREAKSVVNEYIAAGLDKSSITVYSVGRKMDGAMKKMGFPSPHDYTKMSGAPNYEDASALAKELVDGFVSGKFDKVEIVYNHYKSNSSQPTMRQTYLPMSLQDVSTSTKIGKIDSADESEVEAPSNDFGDNFDIDPLRYIIEPDPQTLVSTLLPMVIRLRIYTILLDSSAAEHAARTVAMQTATDNGQDLLQELTLQYNKGRQQKITNELLDIVSGTASN